ncbi:MAG: YggS family pyridoxal phosphate-dependent enzyme [Deltaproteobacteria bacterium]|nr:YggS family pyridoxal phosphate-dependent enzyme [Deltaproteobacteria bacterium]
MSGIAESLTEVRERIRATCTRVGRDPAEVTLVAVSKTVGADAIREAWAAGARVFGENHVAELEAKARALADLEGIEWHLIGHLQRNKVKALVHAELVHSVDSVRLVEALATRTRPGGQRVLVQVSLAGEEQKSGAPSGEVAGILDSTARTGGLVRAEGLMTMPPLTASLEDARPIFRRLRALRDELGGPEKLPHLSMGMSHDFEAAIEEGATLVRVGTAIFGARPVG